MKTNELTKLQNEITNLILDLDMYAAEGRAKLGGWYNLNFINSEDTDEGNLFAKVSFLIDELDAETGETEKSLFEIDCVNNIYKINSESITIERIHKHLVEVLEQWYDGFCNSSYAKIYEGSFVGSVLRTINRHSNLNRTYTIVDHMICKHYAGVN